MKPRFNIANILFFLIGIENLIWFALQLSSYPCQGMCWGHPERIAPDLILAVAFIGAALLDLLLKLSDNIDEILCFGCFLAATSVCWYFQAQTFMNGSQNFHDPVLGIILIMHDSLLATYCSVIKIRKLIRN